MKVFMAPRVLIKTTHFTTHHLYPPLSPRDRVLQSVQMGPYWASSGRPRVSSYNIKFSQINSNIIPPKNTTLSNTFQWQKVPKTYSENFKVTFSRISNAYRSRKGLLIDIGILISSKIVDWCYLRFNACDRLTNVP